MVSPRSATLASTGTAWPVKTGGGGAALPQTERRTSEAAGIGPRRSSEGIPQQGEAASSVGCRPGDVAAAAASAYDGAAAAAPAPRLSGGVWGLCESPVAARRRHRAAPIPALAEG